MFVFQASGLFFASVGLCIRLQLNGSVAVIKWHCSFELFTLWG